MSVQRAVIMLGEIELDVFQMSDGGYQLSEEGTARAAGKPDNSFGRFTQNHSSQLHQLQTLERVHKVEGEKTRVKLVPIEYAVLYWAKEARKGNTKAQYLLSQIQKNRHPDFISFDSMILKELTQPKQNKTKRKTEAWYSSKLQKEIGGVREVPTEAGNIDLLTSTEIIELKEVKNWKCAIGQIETYSFYYPSHTKRVHLFGNCHETLLEIIRKHCDRHEINLTWEP